MQFTNFTWVKWTEYSYLNLVWMEDRALLWVTLNLINTLSRGVFLFRHNQSGSRGVKWKLFVCTWLYNLVWVSTVTFVSIWIKVRPDFLCAYHPKILLFLSKIQGKEVFNGLKNLMKALSLYSLCFALRCWGTFIPGYYTILLLETSHDSRNKNEKGI